MISKIPKEHHMPIIEVALDSFIDMYHELVFLSSQIDWPAVESEFAEYYCADNGRPSVPIRRRVGMMLLKNIYNLSDEGVVARGWRTYTCVTSRERRCLRNVLEDPCGHDNVPEADGFCRPDYLQFFKKLFGIYDL